MSTSSGGPGFLARIARLDAREWSDFLRAHVAVARAAWAVRWRRRGGGVAVRESSESTRSTSESRIDSRRVERARKLSLAVDRACRWSPLRPRCLVRAVALQRLISSAGLEGGEVRIGVQRDPAGFVAHAWVDYGGTILGDAPESVSGYATLEGLDVLPRP